MFDIESSDLRATRSADVRDCDAINDDDCDTTAKDAFNPATDDVVRMNCCSSSCSALWSRASSICSGRTANSPHDKEQCEKTMTVPKKDDKKGCTSTINYATLEIFVDYALKSSSVKVERDENPSLR